MSVMKTTSADPRPTPSGKWRSAKGQKIAIGDTFDHLTVIAGPLNPGDVLPRYRLRCECGREVEHNRYRLLYGTATSCGCYMGKRQRHGENRTRLYGIWCNMKARCSNPNDPYYYCYGERGISVCAEWLHDWRAFRDWSMANGYSKELTIDRIDNDASYSPSNCRWVTLKIQAANRRGLHLITAFGETKHLQAWSEDQRCRVTRPALLARIRRGWDPELAISAPTWSMTVPI